MTSFFQCSCGYTTKNREYAHFHGKQTLCDAVEKPSAFDGSGGLLVMVRCMTTSKFIKWYESEEALREAYPIGVRFRYSYDCDREYIKLVTNAQHAGIIRTTDMSFPMIRNDSAERLFDNYY